GRRRVQRAAEQVEQLRVDHDSLGQAGGRGPILLPAIVFAGRTSGSPLLSAPAAAAIIAPMSNTIRTLRAGVAGVGMIFDDTYWPLFAQAHAAGLYHRRFGAV